MSVKLVPLSILKVPYLRWIVCQANAFVTILFMKNEVPKLRMTSRLTLYDVHLCRTAMKQVLSKLPIGISRISFPLAVVLKW